MDDSNDDVVFQTGYDEEFDKLERGLADGSIDDEELNAILDSWEGIKPKPKDSPAAEVEAQESRLADELGEGFDDRR